MSSMPAKPPMPDGPDAISRREGDVLAGIERRLTNAEIAEELFVSVRTVESHVAALRRKLGASTRAELVDAARARRRSTVQLPRSTFVGRADDLATVRRLLSGRPWVTVVGPAGSGKTRLALELAATDDRVPLVVELERAHSDADVAREIAQRLGLGPDGLGDPTGAVAMALGAHRYLVVLDNCDLVTSEVRRLVGTLLAACPTLTVLATSRSPMGDAAEVVHALAPLPPDDAARLFRDRALAAAPSSDPADDRSVERICSALDGLPLAIELAAARMRHFGVTELADRLDEDLALLDQPGATARHDTLGAAIDWAWGLLEHDERAALHRLAALPVAFNLDTATAVAGTGIGPIAVRLLDRSLLAQTATTTDPRRFRLLHPVREHVLAGTDPAVVDEVRGAHARHIAARAGALARRSRTEDGPGVVAAAAALTTDTVAAMTWAADHDAELAVGLAASLGILFEQCGTDLAGLAALGDVSRHPAVRAAADPVALLAIGQALCYGDLDDVRELAAIALDGAVDDRSRLAAHHLAGFSLAYGSGADEALAHFDEAERLATRLGDRWQLGSIRQGRGLVLREIDPAGALTAFESALREFAAAGDEMHVNNVRYMLASTAASSGLRTDEAVAWATASAAYAEATGNDHELAHAHLALATLRPDPAMVEGALSRFRAAGDLRCYVRCLLLMADGRPPAARIAGLRDALEVARQAHDPASLGRVLDRLLAACWDAGDPEGAATAYGSLLAVVGEEAALDRCPAELRAALPNLGPAVAAGVAQSSRTSTRPPIQVTTL